MDCGPALEEARPGAHGASRRRAFEIRLIPEDGDELDERLELPKQLAFGLVIVAIMLMR